MSFRDSTFVSEMPRVAVGAEVLIAALDGRIGYAKPRARRWLRDFYALEQMPSRLPRPVQEWLRAPHGKHRQCPPLLVPKGEAQLLMRVAQLGVERAHCLVLEVGRRCKRASALPGWGLTKRQAEVLKWLVHGKSNAEIGAILGRKSDTVAKHLQGVFDKLGVDNRSGAIAFAWQAHLSELVRECGPVGR